MTSPTPQCNRPCRDTQRSFGIPEETLIEWDFDVRKFRQTKQSLRCWSEKWKTVLSFRNDGQGKRCKLCAEYDRMWISAVTPAEQAEVVALKLSHAQDVKSMRVVNVRGNKQSLHDATRLSPTGDGLLLKIHIDGMDQSKYRCPRNLVSFFYFGQVDGPACSWQQ